MVLGGGGGGGSRPPKTKNPEFLLEKIQLSFSLLRSYNYNMYACINSDLSQAYVRNGTFSAIKYYAVGSSI